MRLVIQKLSTRCRAPKRAQRANSLVDEVACGPLALELGAQLGPSLDHMAAVIRIKELRVIVSIPASQLTVTKLAAVWAREFSLALHRALAHPDGGVFDVRRHKSQARYNARLIQHLLVEGCSPSWQFPELRKWTGFGVAQSSCEFLLQRSEWIAETFAELAGLGWLEPLLSLWDELTLEQIMHAIAARSDMVRAFTLSSLIELGRHAIERGGLHPSWPVASRRQALRMWSRAPERFHIRDVWHGLRLLVRFLEQPMTLVTGDTTLLTDPIPFPEWSERVVSEDAVLTQAAASNADRSKRSGLESVLQSLRGFVPSAAIPGKRAQWIRSDFCGVLLLLSVIRRMDLWRLAQEPEFIRFGGPRAFSFLLVAIGMNLLGGPEVQKPIDPAVALFAGVQSELDHAGLKHFFSESDPGASSLSIYGRMWPEILQNLATELSRAFAQRIRGFRKASREVVVDHFIHRPGRILLEEMRLLVILEPSPWSAALHISGADDAVEEIEWLPWKRVDFVLEGL